MGQNILGKRTFENLLGGDFPRSTESVIMAKGQKYPVGSVVGKVTVDSRCTLVDSSKSDGTQEVYGVLMHDVDATDADAPGVLCVTGEFNRNHLVFGGSDTWETHIAAARKLCIFFKDSDPV